MKRKIIIMLMVGLMSISLVACGSKKAEKEENEEAIEEVVEETAEEAVEETTEADDKATEETTEVNSTKTTNEVSAIEEKNEEEEKSSEEAVAEELPPQNIVIDGKEYIEYSLIEDESSNGYRLDGRGITLVSDTEMAGTELYVSDDAKELSFDVAISGNGKIVGKTVSVNIDNPVGQIGFSDPADFSDLFKKNDDYTVSFGKGYYDGENTLYVEVFITALHKKMFTTTVEIPLD